MLRQISKRDGTFPSPIGELHFSICNPVWQCRRSIVSVPYRGATFLNTTVSILTEKGIEIVSVPYRGATFLNQQPCNHNLYFFLVSVPYRGATFLNFEVFPFFIAYLCVFPSPIGELHFSILWWWTRRTFWHRFRPLSGSYISQWLFCGWKWKTEKVSVPYRGATFLNGIPKIKTFQDPSFRPLSGSYISQ